MTADHRLHEMSIRVYYEDTDAGGIIYHANYLRFAERGRTELFRAAGIDCSRLAAEKGLSFVVVAADVQYRAPGRLDDLLTMRSRLVRMGGASMEILQDVLKGDQILAEMKITVVCIDRSFKAARLPEELREIFGKF